MSGNRSTMHKKRHGQHQKRTNHFMRVYTPYLPLVVILSLGMGLSLWQPRVMRVDREVLSYATEMSSTGLLSATNQQRTNNGAASLGINAKLSDAAQAKANDMIAHNYWSHTTPDGSPPWVFITNAGYSYSKAGENLAYGFATSSDTVIGWMNSASHRANLLSKDYTEVGFGFANGSNFNSSGQQTVVVAMYASPYIPALSAKPSVTPTPKTFAPTQKTIPATAPTEAPKRIVRILVVDKTSKPISGVKVTLHSEPRDAVTDKDGIASFDNVEAGEHTATIQIDGNKREQVLTVASDANTVDVTMSKPEPTSNQTANKDDTVTPAPTSTKISRIDLLTKGSLPWISTLYSLLAGIGITYLIMKHSKALHKMLVKGERYILHHAVLDVTIISFVWLCMVVSRTVGVIL